jgi:hypothetical protein
MESSVFRWSEFYEVVWSCSVFSYWEKRYWQAASEYDCRSRKSRTARRRVGGEAPVPTFQPVVSSPLPSEPDLRAPPHPALHEHIEWGRVRHPLVQRVLVVKYPLESGAPVFTGGLLPSSRAACSLDPFALWTAFPPSLVARNYHDYYGSSATLRRRQRTVRLAPSKARRAPPGRFPRSLINRSAGSAPSCAQGHRHALPQHGARPRPPEQETVGRDDPQRKRGSSIPTAHSRQFRGLLSCIGASNTDSSPTPFCLATAPGPLAANRCSIVRGRSRPPPHLRHQTAPQLLPAVTAAGGGSFHPTRLNSASWRSLTQDEHQVRPATTDKVPHRQAQAGVTCAPTAPALVAQAYLPCVRERTARDQALTAESHETKKVDLLRDLFCFSNGRGGGLRRRCSPWDLVLALPALGHRGAFRSARGLRRLPTEGIGRTCG